MASERRNPQWFAQCGNYKMHCPHQGRSEVKEGTDQTEACSSDTVLGKRQVTKAFSHTKGSHTLSRRGRCDRCSPPEVPGPSPALSFSSFRCHLQRKASPQCHGAHRTSASASSRGRCPPGQGRSGASSPQALHRAQGLLRGQCWQALVK